MQHLETEALSNWLTSQQWITLREPSQLRFDVLEKRGLTAYAIEFSEDSATVGCDLAEVLLHDLTPASFTGGVFWIARPVFPTEASWLLVEQVLRANGLHGREQAVFLLLENTEYAALVALVALMLMLGWDANFVLTNRRFLLEIDDDGVVKLTSDHASESFVEIAVNLDATVSQLDDLSIE